MKKSHILAELSEVDSVTLHYESDIALKKAHALLTLIGGHFVEAATVEARAHGTGAAITITVCGPVLAHVLQGGCGC